MSSIRRRSHPPPLPRTETAVEPGKVNPRPKLLVATAVLLLALLLITQLQRQSIAASRPGGFGSGPDASDTASPPSDSPFTLHPQDHVFRDATTQTHHWRITSGYRRPDGVLKYVYLVNDAFPGPTIEVRSGDRLVIHVENALDGGEGVSIHWHGLWMRGSNDMDGAVGITQPPIVPGSTSTYNFTVDGRQHGSFWYHAHDGVQRADGVFGGLVVHQPATRHRAHKLASEHLLLVGDWYHRSAQDALEFYMHPGAFGLETLPDSVLVNGAGVFTCSDAVPARPVDCEQMRHSALPFLQLDAQKQNLLRIVNVGAYAGFSVTVSGAQLTPLTVDGGHRVAGQPSSGIGVLHPGERVDALVELCRLSGSEAYLNVTLDEQPFKYQNPALSATHQFPVIWTGETGYADGEQSAKIDSFDIQGVKSANQDFSLPATADYTIVLYTLTQKLASLENEPHGFINRTFWSPQSPPLINLSREEWNKNQFVPSITFNESAPLWVDIVLNNLDEDSHPFHLHGHDFWVLSKYSSTLNWGSFNPFAGSKAPGGEYDLAHPVKKDTFYVPRRGYAVLRFRADNPGLWM